MNILQQINFRQPKYMLPAILYPLILGTGWMIIDMFKTDVASVPDKKLEKTEYLNPSLPEANISDDGIGNRTESMIKSFGRIQDYSAVENIERSSEENTEDYESRYSEEDFAMLDKEAQARTEELLRLREMQDKIAEGAKAGEAMASGTMSPVQQATANNAAALADLERALADARINGRRSMDAVTGQIAETVNGATAAMEENEEPTDRGVVRKLDENAETAAAGKVRRETSSYFNSFGENESESSLIKAIVDEEIKAVDGSRVRLRLLDDIEVNDIVLPKGTHLYATVSGFGSQRIKGSVSSLMMDGELVRVNLSIYDTDGMEGLYVPNSSFRETANDVVGEALDNPASLNETNSAAGSFAQWGMNVIQNAYRKTTSAISKSIRKNKATVKYGTVVYLVNGNEKKNNR